MRTYSNGRGIVNILAADKLIQNPKIYATFLLWLLTALFERLPEVGDPDKPKLVFFFDEAHLLFADLPKAIEDKVVQVVRLIRSKGVGVYFVTQNPLDVPETVLGQLSNRVQHALRAFTPKDQKAVKAAAETFRSNPKLDVAKVITELQVGEAPVSFLAGVYENAVDRESAYEKLKARSSQGAPATGSGTATGQLPGADAPWYQNIPGMQRGPRGGDSLVEAMAKSAARTIGSSVGRQLIRGVLGSLLGGSKK